MNESHARVSPQRRARVAPILLVYAGILLSYGILRLSLVQPSNNFGWSDAQDYLDMAAGPLFTWRFWAGSRPFGVPLIYKLLGADTQRIIVFQFALAVICWGTLATAVARCVRAPWLKPIAFACVLLFSLSSDIVQWDLLILTESITASLFALLLGIALLTIDIYRTDGQPARQRLALGLFIATAAFWSSTRDANAYFLLGVAGLLAIGLLLRRVRRNRYVKLYVTLIAALVAIFVVQGQLAEVYGRWRYPLINIIGRRILVSEERTAFFAAYSMPTDRKVMRYKGKFGHAYDSAILRNQNMEYFRQWLNLNGKQTYTLFLLSRPLETLTDPFKHADTLLRPSLDDYRDRGEIIFPAWAAPPSALMYPRSLGVLLGALGAITLLAIILAARGRAHLEWLIPGALLLLVYPLMLLIWHGDALEPARHSFLLAVQIRLAGWLLLLFVADALLASGRETDVL